MECDDRIRRSVLSRRTFYLELLVQSCTRVKQVFEFEKGFTINCPNQTPKSPPPRTPRYISHLQELQALHASYRVATSELDGVIRSIRDYVHDPLTF
jgi:hypothetical protein